MDVSGVVVAPAKFTSRRNLPRPKFASFGHDVTSLCHEPFSIFNINLKLEESLRYSHNFIFGLEAVTVRKTSFAIVFLQMQPF